MEKWHLTEGIRRLFSPSEKTKAQLDEEYLIKKAVKARRIAAARERGDNPKHPQYMVQRELTIPTRLYTGEPSSTSVLVTITHLAHFRRVKKAENWCAVARLAPAKGQEIVQDRSHPVLGEMICAGADMTQADAKALADLWIRDSYGPLVQKPREVPIPENIIAGKIVVARTAYSIQRPPATR